MADGHDNTQMRGNVPSNIALYVERELDKRVGPLEINDARQDAMIDAHAGKIADLFRLYNASSRGGKVGMVGGGGTMLAGVIYGLYEMFLSGGVPQ